MPTSCARCMPLATPTSPRLAGSRCATMASRAMILPRTMSRGSGNDSRGCRQGHVAMRKVTRNGSEVPLNPLITRDPVTGGELIVTRLEAPLSGLVIEGAFSLGWVGRLTPEQLDFVGLLVRNRGNVQKVAADQNIAFKTARNRLDDIVAALEMPEAAGEVAGAKHERRTTVLQRLSRGE